MALAIEATATGASYMRYAGLIGVPSDVLLVLASVLLLIGAAQRSDWKAVSGWAALSLSGGLFVLVDAMVAMVLPALAQSTLAHASYAGARVLFDVMFAAGTFSAALGAAALWRSEWLRSSRMRWAMAVSALTCLTGVAAFCVGHAAAAMLGPGIAALSASSLVLAVRMLYAQGSEPR